MFDLLPWKDLFFCQPAGRERGVYIIMLLSALWGIGTFEMLAQSLGLCVCVWVRLCVGVLWHESSWSYDGIQMAVIIPPTTDPTHKHGGRCTWQHTAALHSCCLPAPELLCYFHHTHTHTLGLTNTSFTPGGLSPKEITGGNPELSLQFTLLLFHCCHTLPVVND